MAYNAYRDQIIDLKRKVSILRRKFFLFKLAGLFIISLLFFVVVYFCLKGDPKASTHHQLNLVIAYSINPIGLFIVLTVLIAALIRIKSIVSKFEFSELNRGYMTWHVMFILLIATLSLTDWVFLYKYVLKDFGEKA